MNKQQKDIKEDVLGVIAGEQGEQMKTEIRVVKWIVEGKAFGPFLEKRQFSKSKEGTWRMGKAKGFSLKEYETIVENYSELSKLMSEGSKEKVPF